MALALSIALALCLRPGSTSRPSVRENYGAGAPIRRLRAPSGLQSVSTTRANYSQRSLRRPVNMRPACGPRCDGIVPTNRIDDTSKLCDSLWKPIGSGKRSGTKL